MSTRGRTVLIVRDPLSLNRSHLHVVIGDCINRVVKSIFVIRDWPKIKLVIRERHKNKSVLRDEALVRDP